MKTGTGKAGGVERRRAPGTRNGRRSRHVEVVLARIFAKRYGSTKEKTLQHLDSDEHEVDRIDVLQ